MTDVLDKFRHWLIRKLSCGDMILMNFEIRSDGKFISKNLGPHLIADFEIVNLDPERCCLSGGRYYKGKAVLMIADNYSEFRNGSVRGSVLPRDYPRQTDLKFVSNRRNTIIARLKRRISNAYYG